MKLNEFVAAEGVNSTKVTNFLKNPVKTEYTIKKFLVDKPIQN